MFNLITLNDIKPEVVASILDDLMAEERFLTTGLDQYTNIDKQTALNLNQSLGFDLDPSEQDFIMDFETKLDALLQQKAQDRLYKSWTDIELNI